MLRKGMQKLCLGPLLFILCFLNAASASCLPESDSRPEMLHCKSKFDDYPAPVHFFIPQNSSAHYFVHFHGHNLDGFSHFDKRWGDYGQYLLNSKSNSVLVIPESVGKCTTYDTFFVDPIKTVKFFAAVENEIQTLTYESATIQGISGHSGAYRVLNRLAGYANQNFSSLAQIKAIGMFDATYGETPEISKFVQTKHALFYDAFVTGPKATTEDLSRVLMKMLKSENVFFVPVKGESNESLLEQHFMILKRGSLEVFFSKASALE